MRFAQYLVGLATVGMSLAGFDFASAVPVASHTIHFSPPPLRVARGTPALSAQSLPDDAYWSDRFGTPGLGLVYCMTTYQNELIAGGLFGELDGQPAGGLARWDGTAWHALAAGVGVRPGYFSITVEALQVYQGQLIVGGVFDSAGGEPATNVARWNGTAWGPMGTLPEVYDLQEYGGVVYAASPEGLFRWNGSAWSLLLDGYFDDLLLFNNQLVALGDFTVPAGATQVASWNGTAWTLLAHATDWYPNRGVVYRGELYVGGEYDKIDGVIAHGIARWTGSAWQALSPALGGNAVFDLQVLDDHLMVIGQLSAAMGQPAGRVAAWDGTNWSTWGAFNSGYGYARCGWSWNGAFYVGGTFNVAGTSAVWGLTRWTGGDWVPVGPLTQRGVDQPVSGLFSWNDRLVATGSFRAAGKAICLDGLATFDGVDWSPIAMPRHGIGNSYAELYALESWQGDLVVGGHFDQVAGQSVAGVAAWNSAAWHAFGAGLNSDPLTFATYDGNLIAAGRFTASGAQPLAHVAQWDGATWKPMGAGLNDEVAALRVVGGKLYAGGKFTASGANSVSYVAQWDGISWQPVGSGVDNSVLALEDFDGELVAGGAFSNAGGQAAAHVARWSGSAWFALGAGFDLPVTCLRAYGGQLYAARKGITYFSESAAVAAWNGSTWNGLGSGLTRGATSPFGPVAKAMASFGGYLYLGGDFSEVGFKPASYIGRWELPGPSGASETLPPAPAQLTAWPNPSHGPITFRAALRQADTITLEIVDVQGRRVRRMASQALTEGAHLLAWDGKDDAGREVVPGVYLARVVTRTEVASTRVVRLR